MNATDSIDYDFTHDHAGNGWAIVQDMGDNFWRVASITRDGVDGSYASLAWGKKLKRTKVLSNPDDPKSRLVDSPLAGKTLEAVRALRAELKSGEKIVHYQRVMPNPALKK